MVGAGVYERWALGAGVVDGVGLLVGSGRLRVVEAGVLLEAGPKLALSSLNCF
jgi:hypothetical protein